MEALASGDFDTMSDQEWIALCEQIAHDAELAQQAAEAEGHAVQDPSRTRQTAIGR
jgi:hypothetical protein